MGFDSLVVLFQQDGQEAGYIEMIFLKAGLIETVFQKDGWLAHFRYRRLDWWGWENFNIIIIIQFVLFAD